MCDVDDIMLDDCTIEVLGSRLLGGTSRRVAHTSIYFYSDNILLSPGRSICPIAAGSVGNDPIQKIRTKLALACAQFGQVRLPKFENRKFESPIWAKSRTSK